MLYSSFVASSMLLQSPAANEVVERFGNICHFVTFTVCNINTANIFVHAIICNYSMCNIIVEHSNILWYN